jgi:hypothetical protein
MPVEIRELTIKVNVNTPVPEPDIAMIEASMNKLKQEIEAEMARLKVAGQRRLTLDR